jgi:hypothetical protein
MTDNIFKPRRLATRRKGGPGRPYLGLISNVDFPLLLAYKRGFTRKDAKIETLKYVQNGVNYMDC